MATLKDVAKKAGVSIAAVSYCINGTRTISPETRARIQQAIEELQYIPNAQARNLKSNSSKELCVIFPNLENPCYSELLQGMLFEVEMTGYTLTIFCSYNDISKEQELIEEALSKNCAGLLLVTCQPQHTEFFNHRLAKRDIKTVFLIRLPQKMDAMYFGFDNYNTVKYMVNQLLTAGYQDIALLSGPESFFSESEALQGYNDAMEQYSKNPLIIRELTTDTSKEGGFTTFLRLCAKKPPQAIITTSQLLCQGVIEACHLLGLRIPEDICILTLGVDNWNRSSFYPQIIRSAEPAYSMGIESCRYLIRQLEEKQPPEVRFHMMHDAVTRYPLALPLPRDPKVQLTREPECTLRIAAANLPSIYSLKLISEDLEKKCGIRLQFDVYDLHKLFDLINLDARKEDPTYDIYLYDTSWFSYLLNNNCLQDLTDTLFPGHNSTRYFFQKNLGNCTMNNRIYGFPIVGGTQLLLYRKDLFSDPQIARMYKKDHYLSLRPPKTWKEFNSIARFFTRSYNPDSPTEYGTGIASGLNEELILEFEPRMWSHGGGFFDNEGHLRMDTPQNQNALQSFSESFRYSKPGLRTNQDVMHAFVKGDLPMIITFTEYAAQIQTDIHSDYLLKCGYSTIPGNTPANVGWHFGLSPNRELSGPIRLFFNWLYQRHISYYMSILGGASALVFPSQSHELQKLYPWLELTPEALDNCRSRVYPLKKWHGLLAPNAFEAILCRELRKKPEEPGEVSACLKQMQKDIFAALSS